MPHRDITKEDKLYSMTYYFCQSNPNGGHLIHSEDETSSENNSSSDSGSDIVLNEIDDETDVDETDGEDFILTSARSGRAILNNRSADNDWLFY